MNRLTNILSLLFAKQYILVVHDRYPRQPKPANTARK